MNDRGRRFPDDYTIAELHAIATRALDYGDDYARALLREQLEREEFSEPSEIANDHRQLESSNGCDASARALSYACVRAEDVRHVWVRCATTARSARTDQD